MPVPRRLAHPVLHTWEDPDVARISKELRSMRPTVFTFLDTPGIPWHHKPGENPVRQGVLDLKIGGGRRSWRGA